VKREGREIKRKKIVKEKRGQVSSEELFGRLVAFYAA